MISFTENLEKLADMQKLGLEPVRNFSEFTVDTVEKLARKNYAIYGDILNYAISQARLSIDVSEPKELFERQVAAGKEFAELLTQRANEYVDLGKELQGTSVSLFEEDVVKPAKEAAEAVTKTAEAVTKNAA
jgi:hypothetical protein